jgi:maltose/moltooligosaccharide transporter
MSNHPLRALLPLFVVQFACWGGMFLMWVGAYPVITLAVLHSGANMRRGVLTLAGCFSWYAALAAVLAFCIPTLLRRMEPALLLAAATAVGACGVAGLGVIDRPVLLVPCFTALAVGWSALSNLPYTIAGDLVAGEDIAQAFRIFAFSTILPQLAVTAALVFVIGDIDGAAAQRIMLAAGGAMLLGSGLALGLRGRLRGHGTSRAADR